MFFIQTQLSEKPCGHWTEVPAYFYLKEPPACSDYLTHHFLTSPNQIK